MKGPGMNIKWSGINTWKTVMKQETKEDIILKCKDSQDFYRFGNNKMS